MPSRRPFVALLLCAVVLAAAPILGCGGDPTVSSAPPPKLDEKGVNPGPAKAAGANVKAIRSR